MLKFVLVNKEGMYLGQHGWVELAKNALLLDAEQVFRAQKMHAYTFAWLYAVEADYSPEPTRALPHFQDHIRAAA
jgi:hypothetical protein